MLSLKQLKAIEVAPVTDTMPILDAVNDEEEVIITAKSAVIDPDFDRLNKYWQNFYKERGETHYEKMMQQWNQQSKLRL